MTIISIFGGSRPGETDYQQAYELGKRLAKAGYAVQTGGYLGTMEAVSRGAAEAGGHVIGVTCDEIEAWRPVKPNAWIHEEKRLPTLLKRLNTLITDCQAALALPGGPGTLTEIALMWNHLLTNAIEPRPLIIIGAGWKTTFDEFHRCFGAYTPTEQRSWLEFAPDLDSAIELVIQKLTKSDPMPKV